ncbi:hypothetical protein CASFOL_031762 [Castilleja foliolosa]|uniref:Eukaryotic translation initiation factor 3 30 kDa subunit n=1 Tax=Castilleja foliolosa TaxID=1961234 RepID=A0ABD3C677_9LAMI
MENWVLVEEADYKSTSELCGNMGDEKTLDNFIPKSESDFTEYAELVAHKLRPYEKSHHYIGLLKAVMRLSMVSLKGSDAKDVVLSITAIASEKIKVEKVQEVEKANARKKKTEDEPVPSFLKKDYKLKFLCDEGDEDLDNKLKSNWEDKDLDDTDVKDSWEEEDEPAPALKTEKKGNSFEAVKEAPLDPVEEKLRQQRLVGEADYKSTAELFGKMGDEKTLDNFIPKSESDFTEYAELVAHKLRPYEKSHHYIGLLKAVMRLSMVSLKGSDAKDVVLSITAIASEKIKVEKESNAEKKKKTEADEDTDSYQDDDFFPNFDKRVWLEQQVWE